MAFRHSYLWFQWYFSFLFYFLRHAGLFLECPGVTSALLKANLQHIQSPIQSLSIYDFDRTVTALTSDLFASSTNGLQIKHLQFSQSNIHTMKDNSLINLKEFLESLSIVNGKLTNVSRNKSGLLHWMGCYWKEKKNKNRNVFEMFNKKTWDIAIINSRSI